MKAKIGRARTILIDTEILISFTEISTRLIYREKLEGLTAQNVCNAILWINNLPYKEVKIKLLKKPFFLSQPIQ